MFLFLSSRLVSEGRLISVMRRGAGSGGRLQGAKTYARATGGPSRAVPACHFRTSLGPTDGGSRHGKMCWAPFGPEAVDRRASARRGA